ncbi:unnamed protein product [Symbiodinium natans]|uniref:Uncharacterized protein n=1 Tax=Symbiodinium natans TaxID=878477 RepID=A0A812S387_9DINO|nr:unnamed protein product [Symbiodinium natans]
MGCSSSNGQAAPAPKDARQDDEMEEKPQMDSEAEPETQLEAPIITITPPADEAMKVRHELLAEPASESAKADLPPVASDIHPDRVVLQGREEGRCLSIFTCCTAEG